MRILYLTNGFPYPLTSGYLRHYFLIKELARHHAITLLSVVNARFVPEHARAMAPFIERVLTFPSTNKSRSTRRKAVNRLRLLAGADEATQKLSSALLWLTREAHFDVLLCSGKRTPSAIERLSSLPIVVDMCDATSIRIRGNLRYARSIQRPILLLDYLQVRATERRLMHKAAHLLFASSRDREALVGKSGNHATIVPNGIDLDFWSRSAPKRDANTIIFTGVMDYPPNIDAALYLAEEILPRVRLAIPAAQLLIVGRDPAPKLIRAGQRPGVTVTGFVEDIRPYLERATVFAAPLRFGAGIQNKILEALAMELPVVASPLAADGLRTEDGQQPPVQVAHNRQQFAELIAAELNRWATNPWPHTAGRRYVEVNFTWNRSAAKLGRVLSNVASMAEH
ncbi:MAG: glycosyltransferase [Ardenticatenaceae bacterium]|nr:glycosyltransferase [Ardenticatenaceae bacterium]